MWEDEKTHRKYWTKEEDSILLANPDKYGSELKDKFSERSVDSINQRRRKLGLVKRRKGIVFIPKKYADMYARPLTEETAYDIRKDYSAKRKLGYTHEKAVEWLVKANRRYQEIIEDVLVNPKYDAEIERYERMLKIL